MRARSMAVMILLLLSFSVSAALAQTPVEGGSFISVTVQTGAIGTSGNLDLALSGWFGGAPIPLVLDQPGDLQPGMTNTYTFSFPYNMCQIFQFKLTLDGSDQWLGQMISISVNGTQFYYDSAFSDNGPLGGSHWVGGTWDGTAIYRALCPMTPVQVSFATGADGTVDNPDFYLQGNFSASPYFLLIDQPGDLQPNQTDTYNFLVPMPFCTMTGWRLLKGTTGGVDDSWLANTINIDVDGANVFVDNVFYEGGPITSQTQNAVGTWNGTAAYQSRCGSVPPLAISATPIPAIFFTPTLPPAVFVTPTLHFINPGDLQQIATPALVNVNPGVFQIQPTSTPQVIHIRPGTIHILPTSTTQLIHIIPGTLHLAATPTPIPQNPLQPTGPLACDGAPQQRLIVGGRGQVLPGAPNRLRDQPNTSGNVLAMIPAGAVFDVVDGPACSGGYTWWQVNYNGIIGWTAEGTGTEYFVAPIQ